MVYQTSCRNEENYDWGEEVTSQVTHLEDGKKQVDSTIADLLKLTKAKDFLLCFSSSPNFRHSVLPSYKGNRKNKPKPALYPDLLDYCHHTYPCKTKPNLEADDVLGVLATKHPGKYIVASIDKDLLQIPGTHFNWNEGKLKEVTEEEGDWWFYRQILTGDSTDNYTGCPGVGKEGAAEFLANPYRLIPYDYTFTKGKRKGETEVRYEKEPTDNLWEGIVSLYAKAGLTEADALVQARVARILRASDYNFKRKEPILWKP